MEDIPLTDKNLKRQKPKEIENFLIGSYKKPAPVCIIVCFSQKIRFTDSGWDLLLL